MNILEQIKEEQLEQWRKNRTPTKLYLGISEWSKFKQAITAEYLQDYGPPVIWGGMEIVHVKKINYLEVG